MCDTISIRKTLTENGKNILMKNSDRPLGECQPLYFEPARDGHFAVLGSKPYWIRGFEMGANEKGLFIGNEAEGSRCEPETEEGMLGMDMLRCALRSAPTARKAIDVIAGLLSAYGQNANASRLFDRRYENSFILCDPEEIWVMETAGREWAARKIPDFAAVSNCYTIETEYDLCSEQMESLIREKRFLSPKEPVNFAKAFTLPAVRQRNSVPRRRRMEKLLREDLSAGRKTGFGILSQIFRDHFEGEGNGPRFGTMTGDNVSVCMHACSFSEAQTAASMMMTYAGENLLSFLWAPGVPCMSVYLPLFLIPGCPMDLPAELTLGGEFYDEKSLWWRMERLSSLVSADEERFAPKVRKVFDALEESFLQKRGEAEETILSLLKEEKKAEAKACADTLTASSAASLFRLSGELSAEISAALSVAGGLYGPRREFLLSYAEKTGMPLL